MRSDQISSDQVRSTQIRTRGVNEMRCGRSLNQTCMFHVFIQCLLHRSVMITLHTVCTFAGLRRSRFEPAVLQSSAVSVPFASLRPNRRKILHVIFPYKRMPHVDISVLICSLFLWWKGGWRGLVHVYSTRQSSTYHHSLQASSFSLHEHEAIHTYVPRSMPGWRASHATASQR